MPRSEAYLTYDLISDYDTRVSIPILNHGDHMVDMPIKRVLRYEQDLEDEIARISEARHENESVVCRDLLRRGVRDYWAEQEKLRRPQRRRVVDAAAVDS